MVFERPICYVCEHFFGEEGGESDWGTFKCRAFPEGIPRELFFGDRFEGRKEHTEPFPGDNGIRFSLKKGEEKYIK